MSHYFTSDDTPHEFNEVKFSFNNHVYRFKTDRGVFSKNQVDYGSEVLIKAVSEDFKGEGQFIDMGAGYGPISVVLGKTLNMRPIMVEVNEDALSLSVENAGREKIEAEVLLRKDYDEQAFDVPLYVTNPPFRTGKSIVINILEDGYDRLADGGVFYMVVQKKQGMQSYKKYLDTLFGNVEIVAKDKGYYILKSSK